MSIIERVECLVESQRACMEFLPHTEQNHRDDYDRNTKELIADIKAMEQSIPDNSLSREAFEKSLPQGFSLKRIHSINGNGAYHNSTVHTKWISWQAALSSRVDVEATIRSDNTQVIVNMQAELDKLREAQGGLVWALKQHHLNESVIYADYIDSDLGKWSANALALALASGEVAI